MELDPTRMCGLLVGLPGSEDRVNEALDAFAQDAIRSACAMDVR